MAYKRILIGTSGYAYDDWVGSVYPPDTPAKNFLDTYSRALSFVELNSSFNRMPDSRTLSRIIHGAARGFSFAVKAHKTLTHALSADIKADAMRFKEGIYPLIESGMLQAILLQFPARFDYTPVHRTYLQRVCDEFAGINVAVEFRSAQWHRESVYAGLKKKDLAFVNIDAPESAGLCLPSINSTSHFAYVRLHGRNAGNWNQGINPNRYDYHYSENELAEWAGQITQATRQVDTVIVVFNNRWGGRGFKNAMRMKDMLSKIY
jgi:uncharacterized protein YecE (DUF72 family)